MMEKHLVQDYLQKSGMPSTQADALSRILAEMATKNDLLVLEQKIETRLQRVSADMRALRSELRADMQALETRLTWRFIAGIGFFATVMALLDLFVD